jgi:hypothetical protein
LPVVPGIVGVDPPQLTKKIPIPKNVLAINIQTSAVTRAGCADLISCMDFPLGEELSLVYKG